MNLSIVPSRSCPRVHLGDEEIKRLDAYLTNNFPSAGIRTAVFDITASIVSGISSSQRVGSAITPLLFQTDWRIEQTGTVPAPPFANFFTLRVVRAYIPTAPTESVFVNPYMGPIALTYSTSYQLLFEQRYAFNSNFDTIVGHVDLPLSDLEVTYDTTGSGSARVGGIFILATSNRYTAGYGPIVNISASLSYLDD